MIRSLRISFLVIVLLFVITIASVSAVGHGPTNVTPDGRIDQGCVNQGTDLRMAAPVVCGMQRKLSWKSENPPHLFRLGNCRRTHVAIAWPPYVVVNSRRAEGHWLMFRMGFRYDQSWHGYIFPTAAFKSLDHPVQY